MDIVDFDGTGAFSITYKGDEIFSTETEFGTLSLIRNTYFGAMLFFENELQIDERFFDEFHHNVSVLANVTEDQSVLIVGDGDGGFTRMEWSSKNVDYVERDEQIMKVGTDYFGADWSKVTVHHVAYEDFIQKNTKKYDVVLFMVTDPFMRENVGNTEFLREVVGLIKQGGTLFFPIGCNIDSEYEQNLVKLDNFLYSDLLSDARIEGFYHPSFFSNYMAFICKVR